MGWFSRERSKKTAAPLRLGLLLVAASSLASGCGIAGGTESSAALVSGLPKCDPSLLHPRITVGTPAGVPGKLIVYVDGVMACVDDSSRVDQILQQVEGYAAPAVRPQ
jgi:hypothetical protein